ncbi:hypothetical protein PN462_03635 [Spirulina sp. CS-785/01]|uniref:hypothetical protein n=1 Tax=Spirulina sp. CS-785/01 TaxID=3021716 RepID=UPI00232C057A|nr:hypothetical protein [Spirulina sp. CS-785/01]MDB9312182.1 hypothetical protein [Spirulina sp. CS-785/01]
MYPSIQLLPGAIGEILATASETGIISEADRYGLMAAVLEDRLNEEERRAVNRLLRAIRRGKVTVKTASQL